MLDTGSDKAKRKALEAGSKGEYKKKWMKAVFNRAGLRDKHNSLLSAQKQILLKNLIEDDSLKIYLIARDKMPHIPPD